MTVTLQLANQVRRLRRVNLTVEQIAVRLSVPEAAILDTLSMLGLPLPGVPLEERSGPTDEERTALGRGCRGVGKTEWTGADRSAGGDAP